MSEQQFKQKDFKTFEKVFNQVRRANQQDRLNAVGLLTPSKLRKHLKSGQDLVLAYGRKGHTVTFTVADLKSFANQIERSKKRNRKGVAGIPLLQLEKASWMKDKVRMQTQIRNATLYRFLNNVLHFQVTASGLHGADHHQVKVRLEDWYDNLTDPISWVRAAKAVSMGRLSFDCTCGRHQYWFRYLATIGNFALTPKEKDFPKLRNPRLRGCCCKHVLKVLQQLKSPSIHTIIAKEMERQADAIGYVDKGQSRFLNAKELAKAKRAKGSNKDRSEAKKAYKEFRDAKKAYALKVKERGVQKKREEERAKSKAKTNIIRMQKQTVKKLETKLSEAERDRLVAMLGQALAVGIYRDQKTKEQVIGEFSKENDMPLKEIEEMSEQVNV